MADTPATWDEAINRAPSADPIDIARWLLTLPGVSDVSLDDDLEGHPTRLEVIFDEKRGAYTDRAFELADAAGFRPVGATFVWKRIEFHKEGDSA